MPVLSLLSSKSDKEIEKKFRNFDETTAKDLYLQVLTEIQESISVNNVECFKKLDKVIAIISKIKNKTTLMSFYRSEQNPIRNTNLIILACKQGVVKILEYIFSKESHILDNLSVHIDIPIALPHDEDDECHNSFYYAIRSSNVELLDVLITKWPNSYFDNHLDELDEILSKAYEEIKLKNISLSDEMELSVENQLIDLRFFSKSPGKTKSVKSSLDNVKERIELLLTNINMLTLEYSGMKEIDQKFLLSAKFIAQNIHILKRQLKPTYDRFPWEEMEFCLIAVIKSKIKHSDLNLICNYILTKKRILMHLSNFACKLNETDISPSDVSNALPRLKREDIIVKIINNVPSFEQLYDDYEKVADIYSLNKISSYIILALMVNPKEGRDRLIITRALQVTGEYLKNTLESPKLSTTTSELLLLTMPKDTREILTDLRNSLSHAFSLSKRTEIEGNDVAFFTKIQNDLKKISVIAVDILFKTKIKIYRLILRSIINSENFEEIREMAHCLHFVTKQGQVLENSNSFEHEKIKELIQKLDKVIGEKTKYESTLFAKMNDIINSAENQCTNNETDDIMSISMLVSLRMFLSNYRNIDDSSNMRVVKCIVSKMLKNLCPKSVPQNIKEITEIAVEIENLVKPRLQPDSVNEVDRITLQLFYVTEFEIDNIEWLGQLREKLTKNKSEKLEVNPEHNQKKTDRAQDEIWHNQLKTKLSNLENILKGNALNKKLFDNYLSFKNDKKLQVAVEMLLQDIMSILESSRNYLTNNLLFLDDYAPLLIGKSFRNHLAHGNALVDVLLFDPSIALILNAKKLVSENMASSNRCIGKFVQDVPSYLKNKCDQNMQVVVNQEALFCALEEGNIEVVKSCIKKGADIKAKSINLWTALHFAAKSPNFEIVEFIFNQDLIAKDIDGQSPLHIAAASGRKSSVEFFVKEKGLKVDDINNFLQTPLHLAAQNGHTNVIEVLLKNGAETSSKDLAGYSPLHYAIINNHKDIVILLQKELNVDANETMGGYTPLHLAAENGYLEIVNFLIQNKANVNFKNDRNWTPLHAAALNGHLEVVQVLIANGANVNAKILTDSCTPLHYAVENGHDNIVKILLKHGAKVDSADKVFYNVPLHYAAGDGHVKIVDILIRNQANVNVVTVDGMTPLHFAAQGGHLEIVDILLKNNTFINAENINGCTALHLSSFNGHENIVQPLLNKGAKVHSKDKNNRTPLHLAGMSGNEKIVELLIARKAVVDAVDFFGFTTLHLSSVNGHINAMAALIRKGANVNAKDKDGLTPLHLVSGASSDGKIANDLSKYAANIFAGSKNNTGKKVDKDLLADDTDISFKLKDDRSREVVKFLLDNGASVCTRSNDNFTPLHIAALDGNVEVIGALIKGKAEVNAEGQYGYTPLHLSVQGDHQKVIAKLIQNGAKVDTKNDNGQSSLVFAIKHNYKEAVELLITNGAHVDDDTLSLAVFCGFKNIVEILLRNKRLNVNRQTLNNASLLHLAAKRGSRCVVELLIENGADVNAETDNLLTPVHFAAQEGHEEVVDVLLAKNAKLNCRSTEGLTPLHAAATQGHKSVVDVLLRNKVDVNIKDNKNRTAIEFAIAHGYPQVVKALLQCKDINLKAKGNDDWTVLHIASQGGNLEVTKSLIDAGADINAKNSLGSKPIHIAAREGYKDIVQMFLSNGCCIDNRGAADWTLLHYAATGGHLEMSKYLLKQNIDINAIDANGFMPIHAASDGGFEDIVKCLLSNSAICNAVDNFNRKPIDLAKNESISNVLKSTEQLFSAIKCNDLLNMEKHIKAGAFINAKNVDNVMPLHYAAWKGYETIVDALLKSRADPNVIGKSSLTPLHYASKFSHVQIVKTLLSNGAMYDCLTNNFKTPLDLAVHGDIIDLLNLMKKLFAKVQNGDTSIIDDLKKLVKDDMLKPVLNACNKEGQSLMIAGIHSDFPKIETFKEILLGDVRMEIDLANALAVQEKYQDSLSLFRTVLTKKKKIFSSDNPCILDIQSYIASVLYKQKNYQEALKMFQEIHRKQKELLGTSNKDTLKTRSTIALILHRQGKNTEALMVFQEIVKTQKEILGTNHPNTVDTLFHMALVLNELEKYDEAISINREIFETRKQTLGENNLLTLSALNNVAMVLNNQGKHDDAAKLYKQVYETRKRVLGPTHSDSLRTLHNMATVLLKQKKYDDALNTLQEVLDLQRRFLGSDHIDTLNTQHNIANILFAQGKWVQALAAFKNGFERRKAILGVNHPSISDILIKLEMIEMRLKLEGTDASEIMKHIQSDIFVAANNGDVKGVQDLLNEGTDVNARDTDGRTPLHFAANHGHKDVVCILLKHGADASIVSTKGNTSLHSATSRGNEEIIEMLLQHVKQENMNKFDNYVNAKTVLSGSTSLHIATKNGYLEIAKCLLKHGAIYNVVDKSHNKTPLDYSKNQNIIDLLNFIDQLFNFAEMGNSKIIDKLSEISSDVFQVTANARNNQGQTLVQIAIINKHKTIARKLIKMLQ